MEKIEGIVSSVISRENWARVVIKTNDDNSIVCVGTCFPPIYKGQSLTLTGSTENNPKYGPQFKTVSCQIKARKTAKEIEYYLSSGMFKGIGPSIARMIVEEFGENTLEILDKNPDRLLSIKGIGKIRGQLAIDAYIKNKDLEELSLFLMPHGVTLGRVNKIYERYGKAAEAKLKENPYTLCRDIKGIGFLIADDIARSIGIKENDLNRLVEAINYCLKNQGSLKGHTYLLESQIAPTVRELLNKNAKTEVPDIDILNALEEGIAAKRFIRKEDKIFFSEYFFAEQRAAERLRNILWGEPKSFITGDKIEELEEKLKIKFAAQQIRAILETSNNLFQIITGGPGTGKTTIIRAIVAAYKEAFPFDIIEICAPTGRAAKRITETSGYPAKTVHKLIGKGVNEDGTGRCKFNKDNPLPADFIIVDESSMLDILLFSDFLEAVRNGTKILIVGDVDQLPSVGAGNVLADLLLCDDIPKVFLNEIFRQKNTSKIIINAKEIKEGNKKLEFGNDFVFIEANSEAQAQEVIVRKVISEIKQHKGNMDSVQVLSPVRKKTLVGVNELNLKLQSLMNPKLANSFGELYMSSRGFNYRKNDKVIINENGIRLTPDGREVDAYNGDIGYITEIKKDGDSLSAYIKVDDNILVFSQADLECVDLAYCTTVHKSQGSEYPVVILPLVKSHKFMLSRKLFYTGVTRAKQKVILVGDYETMYITIQNNKKLIRQTDLADKINRKLGGK